MNSLCLSNDNRTCKTAPVSKRHNQTQTGRGGRSVLSSHPPTRGEAFTMEAPPLGNEKLRSHPHMCGLGGSCAPAGSAPPSSPCSAAPSCGPACSWASGRPTSPDTGTGCTRSPEKDTTTTNTVRREAHREMTGSRTFKFHRSQQLKKKQKNTSLSNLKVPSDALHRVSEHRNESSPSFTRILLRKCVLKHSGENQVSTVAANHHHDGKQAKGRFTSGSSYTVRLRPSPVIVNSLFRSAAFDAAS